MTNPTNPTRCSYCGSTNGRHTLTCPHQYTVQMKAADRQGSESKQVSMTNPTKVAAASETPESKAHSHNIGSVSDPDYVVDLAVAERLERQRNEARRELATIMARYEMRSELYTSDEECARVLYDTARLYLDSTKPTSTETKGE